MLEKNQLFEAKIIDLTAEGQGVCKVDGMAVFVPDTAVGDVIRGKIVKVLRNYAFGIINEIITPSADRIIPSCPHAKKCGGCLFQHITYEAECNVKNNIIKNAFLRIGGLSPEFDDFMACDSTFRYRNKAQYPVAEVDGNIVCGFFAPRSHRIIHTDDCILQPEIFSDINKTILDYLKEKKISAYSEASNTGIVRHIYLRIGTHSGEIMVCLVVRKDISYQLNSLGRILSEKYPAISSFIININPDKTNVILGKKCITIMGKDSISDIMCGNEIEISPLSFYQVNTIQAERLYAKALEFATPESGDIIADLYCGAGTIGLSMAQKCSKIVGVEIVAQAIENASRNAVKNNISNVEFYCGDAGKVFADLRKNGCQPNIIIIDPPRKGCSESTLEVISKADPRKIIMISCNPATAARDAKWLSLNGFSVDKVCGVDLFPRTGHVECVVLMSRNKD